MFDDLIIPKKHREPPSPPKPKKGVDLKGATNNTSPIVHSSASPCPKCNSADLSVLMHHLNPYTGRKEFFVECRLCGHQYWSL